MLPCENHNVAERKNEIGKGEVECTEDGISILQI